jgi:hypothetical protein
LSGYAFDVLLFEAPVLGGFCLGVTAADWFIAIAVFYGVDK